MSKDYNQLSNITSLNTAAINAIRLDDAKKALKTLLKAFTNLQSVDDVEEPTVTSFDEFSALDDSAKMSYLFKESFFLRSENRKLKTENVEIKTEMANLKTSLKKHENLVQNIDEMILF